MNFLNVIIDNGNVIPTDHNLFPHEEEVLIIKPDDAKIRNVLDLLIILGSFPSISQAKKNWNGPIKFPDGWNEFHVGKLKRHLCIWNPTEGLT
jgi:hypothetical protein